MRTAAVTVSRREDGGSLARQLLLLQALVVGVVVLTATAVAYLHARDVVRDTAAQRATTIVATLADSPLVVDAVTGPDPTAVLEPYVKRVRADTGTSFITVFAPDRTRFTHPDPDQIGRPFRGTIAPALAGRTFTETYTGTLGPSVRATGPVVGRDGTVVALVSAGITEQTIGGDLTAALPGIAGSALATLLVGGLGSWAISRRLRRQTRGLGAAALTRMVDYYNAVLHAVREGLLLLDHDQRVQLVNDEARRLLDLDGDPTGRSLGHLGLAAPLTERLAGPEPVVDEVHVSAGRVLVVNQAPAILDEAPGRSSGRRVGSVVTLRDHTDLQALTGELDSVRAFAESLRAQAHEAANRLHTTVSLVELGRSQDAVDFAVAELASAQRLTDRVVHGVGEPVLAALVLGKAATAHERDVLLDVDSGTAVGATGIPGGDLVTVVGNLLDNAIDAALAGDPPREVQLAMWVADHQPQIRVEDSGPGVTEEDLPWCSGVAGRRRRTRQRPGRSPRVSAGGSGWRWWRRRSTATGVPSPCARDPERSSASRCRCAPRPRRRDDQGARGRGRTGGGGGAAAYVERTPGFSVAGVAGTAAGALEVLARSSVHLVLLDMNLPDAHGLELCRRLRASGADVDVLAVTAARELATVRAAVAHGVVGYLLKPFTYAGLRERLMAYAQYRERLARGGDVSGQADIDRVLGAVRSPRSAPLPKGMGRETLEAVISVLRNSGGLSATEAVELIGASRITARRYLEYLADAGLVDRVPRYGGTGRPEHGYHWR